MALQVVGMLSRGQSCQNSAVADGQQLLVVRGEANFDASLIDF
jgi:hypothetical protein